MRTIYLDCGMGAAGDMLTAALLELHERPETVLETLNRAFAGKAVLSVQKDQKCGIAGSHVTVTIDGEVEGEAQPHGEHHHHRHTTSTSAPSSVISTSAPSSAGWSSRRR